MAKWIAVLFILLVALVIVGFLIDVARVFVGLAIIVLIGVAVWRFVTYKR